MVLSLIVLLSVQLLAYFILKRLHPGALAVSIESLRHLLDVNDSQQCKKMTFYTLFFGFDLIHG